MISSHKKRRVVLTAALALAATFACVAAYVGLLQTTPADQPADAGEAQSLPPELTLEHYFVSAAQLEKFRPGRPKNDILTDIHWRGGFVEGAIYAGKAVVKIDYALQADYPADTYRSAGLHAIFVGGRFEKFVRWDYGNPLPRLGEPSPVLVRVMGAPPVTVDELRKEAESQTPPQEGRNYDLGLTLAVLPVLPRLNLRDATTDEYRRNAALREQFHAARLDIGMSEQEVEGTVRAKPIESAELDVGSCRVYGSGESSPVGGQLRYKNVAVIFREGRAIAFFRVDSSWHRDFPGPTGTIDFLRKRDASPPQP